MYTDKDLTRFCQNIKALRTMHNLSKTKMASMLKISKKSLETIESGTIPKRLSLEILTAVIIHFGITPHELFKTPLEPK